jgi:histidine triad (HIT) family protein
MCLFCKIVDKEIPANIVYEDEKFLAFHDINPKAPVHVLAIPKKHFESFATVDPKIMEPMTAFMQKVASQLSLQENGYRVITNIGDDGGQEVKHLHFHILGGAKLKWEHFSDADPKDFI